MEPMEFCVLGPLEVAAGAAVVDLGAPKQRTLLAVLACHANQVVSTDRLLQALWGSDPPRTAPKNVQLYVHHLRRSLGDPQRIVRRPPGYTLRVQPDELDAHRFRGLVRRARPAMAGLRPAEARVLLDRALALWRGPAFADIDTAAVREEAAGLEEARLAALELRLQADLDLGRHADAIPELSALISAYPLREGLRGQLMVALYRARRQAEALAVYREVRRVLADELGLEPNAELRRLEQAILGEDPALDLPPPPAGTAAGAAGHRPRQLPARVGDLVGRAVEAAAICEALTPREGAAPELATVVVSAVAGKGGVGKTALAVEVAHRLRERFPDGQLFVNLRGVEAAPADPAQVLGRFLRSLGVEAAAVPDGLEERAALYRSELAERRVLVVLDNAADEGQVVPLLPGSPSCGVVVTSRRRLTGLTGARLVELDVLEPELAVELLGRVAGAERVAAEPETAAELAGLCGHLPLALRIAGARLAARPHWRVARLVERLADARRRLDELAHGQLEVRASLTLSYRGLDPTAQVLFRRLGLLDAPDVAAWVAAALLDSSVAHAEDLLDGLVDARLMEVAGLDATGQVRYHFHDLVRVLARERAEAEEPAATRAAALTRAFGAWLALAERAFQRVHGGGGSLVRGDGPRWLPAGAALTDQVLADPCAWVESERHGLVAAVRQARQLQLDELCWNLAVTAANVNPTRGSFEDWRQAHEEALAATRTAGNRRGEAIVMTDLGSLYSYQDRYDEALEWLRRALPLLEQVGERHGHAIALTELAVVERLRGRLEVAQRHFEDARVRLHAVGDRLREAYVLRNIGQIRLDLGDSVDALPYFEQALGTARAVGSLLVESQVLYWLGEAHLAREALADAEHAFQQDLEIAQRLRDRHGEALALHGLGRTHLRQGGHGRAEVHLARALAILEEASETYVAGQVLVHLGELHHALGDLGQAAEHLTRALELFRELETPQWQARTLQHLGAVHHTAGSTEAARAALTQAQALFADLGAPQAEQLATQLQSSGP